MDGHAAAVDSAALVFAHSILDSAALDYCRVTALVDLEVWTSSVEKRKFELRELKHVTYNAALRHAVDDFIDKLDRESLLAKLDRLLSVCKPTGNAGPKGYTYDRARLEHLDNLRHEAVHGSNSIRLPNADGALFYLMQTATYLMVIVNARFGVKISPAMAAEDGSNS